MNKQDSVSDETLIQAIATASHKASTSSSFVSLQTLTELFPDEENLLKRLQQIVNKGKLRMTYAWKNFAAEGITGVNPAVGYCSQQPLFSIL